VASRHDDVDLPISPCLTASAANVSTLSHVRHDPGPSTDPEGGSGYARARLALRQSMSYSSRRRYNVARLIPRSCAASVRLPSVCSSAARMRSASDSGSDRRVGV